MEECCLLAKGQRGLAMADLIQRVTSDPHIFAFGELLSMPQVQEVWRRQHYQSAVVIHHPTIGDADSDTFCIAAGEEGSGQQPCPAAVVQHRHMEGLRGCALNALLASSSMQ